MIKIINKVIKMAKFSSQLCFYFTKCVQCFIKSYKYMIVLMLIVCKMCIQTTASSPVAVNSSTIFPDKIFHGMDMNQFADTAPIKGWNCFCWNTTSETEDDLECSCMGEALVRIPQKLQPGMSRLTITSAGLPMLRNTGLKIYASSLRDITLTHLNNLESIQAGAFASIKNLRTIYISYAPKLTYLSKDVFFGISKSLKTIRINYSGLIRVPDMRHLSTGIILHMVDLEGNRIANIDSHSVRIKTEQLILDNNVISSIADNAFSGSEIAKLSIKGNTRLKQLELFAFDGINNIQELDLSSTSIVDLPPNGLQGLEVLRVQNTHSLKTIPSIYEFKSLQVAWLTHPFHCCAFKFPARHDPSRHTQRLKYLESLQKACLGGGFITETKKEDFTFNEDLTSGIKIQKKRSPYYVPYTNEQNNVNGYEKNDGNESNLNLDMGQFIEAITGSPIVLISAENVDIHQNDFRRNEDFGEFHETTADIVQNHRLDAMCGNLTQNKIEVNCSPMPDALNPCEDVMGSYWLRISVWVVVLLAVFGNVAVLVVLLSNRSDLSVPKFLMSNLAFADLCMGLYLLLIASIDAHSMGEYFNYAFDWQYGTGCKVAGFLTVFASHLSVFTLTIITLERWFAITHAIYLNKRIKIKPATYIMIGGWLYSCCMSSFPLFGISNYSSTSICLPMEARDSWDVVYIAAILGLNGAAFFIIAICYAQIYFSLGKETRRAARNNTTGEMTIAKKMALLVFTNFSCWAPIGFFGLTALAGYPLINLTKSKILLVFFYPLNSCADPYLYALLTAQYRRDLYLLLSKFGICTKKAQQYKNSFSNPQTNVSFPMSLVPRNSLSHGNHKTTEDHLIPKEEFV